MPVVLTKSGRASRKAGATAQNAVLTERKVRNMRRIREEHGTSITALAHKYRVSEGCVGCVLRRDTWKHI